MRLRNFLIACSGAVLFVWGSGWAQQNPDTQNPETQNPPSSQPSAQQPAVPANSATTESPQVNSNSAADLEKGGQKEKNWTGSLVDVSCMAKALSSSPARPPATSSTAQAPHFMGENGNQQMGQRPGTPMGQQQNPTTSPTYPGQGEQNPDISQSEAAKMARISQVDNAAKQCAATTSTQAFGLALSDGTVMKFDDQGNTKATESLKEVGVKPGKKVKAKVTGVMEDGTTVKVASVTVKGKKVPPTPSSSGSGL